MDSIAFISTPMSAPSSSGGGGASGNAVTSYPNTNSGLGLALIDDAAGFVTADYAGVSYVFAENAAPPLPGGIFGDKYWPWSQSDYGTPATFDLTWVKTNHPDWLLYITSSQIDANLAWYFGNANAHPPTIDLTNAAARQWVVDTLWKPKIAAGWKGVAIDNNPSINVFGNQGTNGNCAKGHFTLGGSWVPLYSGSWMDTAYVAAQKSALQAMIDYLHLTYPSVPVMVNNGFSNDLQYHVDGGTTDALLYDTINFMSSLGGLMTEGGFNLGTATNRVTSSPHGVLSNPWLYLMTKYSQAWANCMGVFIAKAPYTVTANMTTANTLQASGTLPRDDFQWNAANALMARGPYFYFYFAGNQQYTQKIGQITQAELTAIQAIGSPTGSFQLAASGPAYTRPFSGGEVWVNPDATNSQVITLPGGTWKDLWGVVQGATVTVPATSGLVLTH